MKKSLIRLTTSQFAKLHEVNKRTLHYYDTIGLFSPKDKGENGYRYYDLSQSIDFEYIRMLKDLNMSIEEIMTYHQNPSPTQFIQIADIKEHEIDLQIHKLEQTKKILQNMKKQIKLCENISQQDIQIIECEEEKLLILPYDFNDDNFSEFFSYVKNTWTLEQMRMGIGGFISIDKIMNKDFEIYDGIYTIALPHSHHAKSIVRAKGKYLCAYQKGTWDQLPAMYQKIMEYAKAHHIQLTGYAYEIGLNEFVIQDPQDYITQITIKIDE